MGATSLFGLTIYYASKQSLRSKSLL